MGAAAAALFLRPGDDDDDFVDHLLLYLHPPINYRRQRLSAGGEEADDRTALDSIATRSAILL